jgi:hypothetical protein
MSAVATAALTSITPEATAGGAKKTETASSDAAKRAADAFQVRLESAKLAKSRREDDQFSNGDEARYPTKFGSFSKGLPHDGFGEVDLQAFGMLVSALESGDPAQFECIPLGLGRRLTNPQAALAFDLEGADSHALVMAPPPSVSSDAAGSELLENYWMAEARDVSFVDYSESSVIDAASNELSGLLAFSGPRMSGRVTPATAFRGSTPGDTIGPYLSQFLWLDVPMGAVRVEQRMSTAMAAVDYLRDYSEWLHSQNGGAAASFALDGTTRYIRNLRDVAQWVHVDALYQAYHQACLILLGLGAPLDPGNPYVTSRSQEGFATFGDPHILSLVTEVATRALKAVWYQKWAVHRRLRPEAMGGLVHHTRSGSRSYPLSRALLNAHVLDVTFAKNGSYLLPVAFAEGSPTHPSYGAGHATVAGACVTVLKAWFDESYVLPNPVVADRDGTSLLPYTGPDLTVGNELNKLAGNVANGRNAAGIHYRSDYWESVQLGERLALSILEEQKATYNETASFSLTRFDGQRVTV